MDAIKDLAKVTCIPVSTLNKLSTNIEDIICHSIKECYLSNENVTEIDLGLGKLIVFVNEDAISYKFIPSQQLENKIIKSIDSERDVMITHLEESLRDKIVNCYKDLF